MTKVVISLVIRSSCPLQSNNFEFLAFSMARNLLFSVLFYFFALIRFYPILIHFTSCTVHLEALPHDVPLWIITLLLSCSLRALVICFTRNLLLLDLELLKGRAAAWALRFCVWILHMVAPVHELCDYMNEL